MARLIFDTKHSDGSIIRVLYDRIDEGGEGAGLDILHNGLKALRAFNPAEVTSWFSKNSKANVEPWRDAYHKSGLTQESFVRPAAKGDVILAVPYKSQRDNLKDPFGTCNVTSYAMAMDFLKVKRNDAIINPRTKKPYAQFEDELSAFLEKNGKDRHAHDDLAWMGRQYGLDCTFSTRRTFDEIISEIRAGRPVIVSTVLTSAGHIILLRGIEVTNFVVNDPFGNATTDYSDKNGNGVRYSFDLMRRKMRFPGQSQKWAHFLRPKTG